MKKKQKKKVTVFDPTKPVETRDGRKARILTAEKKGKYPILALVDNEDEEEVHLFSAKGLWEIGGKRQSEYDLVNVPEKHSSKKWVNCYPDDLFSLPHKTREGADRVAGEYRRACIEVTFEFVDGEGLTFHPDSR